MRQVAGDTVQVYSGGTKPGATVDALSAEALSEVGVDITHQTPKLIDPQLVSDDIAARVSRSQHTAAQPARST